MRIKAASRRLLRDTRGVTVVLLALTLWALIGFAGLGVETGLWYAIKRQNQSAADVAALSGAFEVLAGQPYSDMCGFAKRDAARDGFVFASYTCPTSTPACTSPASGQMCANNPPVLGASAGNIDAFEVILSQNQGTLLATLYLPSVTIKTRAVALISVLDQVCVLTLDPMAPQALLVQGNSSIIMPNCSLVADSTDPNAIFFQGSAATVTADTLVSAGGVGTTGKPTFHLNTPAHTNAPPVSDPYAATLTHSFLTIGMPPVPPNFNCAGLPTPKATTTYPANSVFCSGLATPHGGGTVNLEPGTYWVTDGDLAVNSNGVLQCTSCNGSSLGVTIIFTTAKGAAGKIAVTMVANAQIGNINAPNSGIFAGLLFVQDTVAGATYTSAGSLQGGSSLALNSTGLVYFPHTNLTFQGTPQVGTNGCLLVVANQVQVAGDSTLSATGCSSAGLGTTPTVKTVALAE